MYRTVLLLAAALCLSCSIFAQNNKWQNRSLSDDDRIDAVISSLNLEEKIALLGGAGVPRLGIKSAGGTEAIHGLVLGGPANEKRPQQITSSFPQGYGLGQTWDPELMQAFGEQMSTEARILFQAPDGNKSYCGLVLWAPNADIGRDPRWGRTEECFGEDPTLVGELAAAVIKGIQGPDPKYWRAASLMKHFLANSNEDDRGYTSSDFSDKLWREYYSYGFHKGFDAGGSSYMAAYNKVNGIPCTVHPMLRDIVADEWGVKGIVTTDGGAFSQLVDFHHYFDDLPTAAAACIHNGVNRFLDRYVEAVQSALDQGLVTEADIDKVIRGEIYVMLRLGLLDDPTDKANPYLHIGVDTDPAPWNSPSTHALVRKATDESVVLLKNEGLLPLNTNDIKRILVIGNKADTVYQDWYGGNWPYYVTPLQAIRNIAEPLGIEVEYFAQNTAGRADEAARRADVVIACVGSHPITATDYDKAAPPWGASSRPSEGREAIDRQSLQLESEDLLRVVYKNNPDMAVVLISSYPYSINWTAEHAPAILHTAQSSQELGNAIADVLFGRYNPAGRLTQTWPKAIDDLPDMMDYNIENGRTYMYTTAEPLFCFGHGLSYTDFDYSNLVAKLDLDNLTVSFDLTNTGSVDGDEVAQIYVKIPGDKAVKRLKGFKRCNLKSGEKRNIKIDIPLEDLRVWDTDLGAWILPKGEYTLMLGASSNDIRASKSIKITK